MAYASPADVEVETSVQDEEEDIDLDDLSYDDTEHMDDIYESLHSFDIRSQPGYTPALEQSMQQESLLCHWAYDYQRHEWIATRFQQPPYTTTVHQSEQEQ